MKNYNYPAPTQAPTVDMKAVFSELNAKQADWQKRATDLQPRAAQAFLRLLQIAETSDTGQASRVAKFLAATFNGFSYSFDVFELRAVDVEISDDMLLCLDALRWAKADLHTLVPDGHERVRSIVHDWQIKPSVGNGDQSESK